jgi:hypothetical protein
VLSAAALLLNRRLQGQANKLQLQIVKIEQAREADRIAKEQKALVVAAAWQVMALSGLSHSPTPGGPRRGTCGCRSMVCQSEIWPNHNPHSPTILGPMATFEYSLVNPKMNQPYPTVVEITWEDDSGVAGRFQTVVNITR